MTHRPADPNSAPPVGLYVSVPFCRAKCSFCNFASGVGSGAALARYVDQLCAEIVEAPVRAGVLGARLPSTADTVYLGGGTPSLLAPAQLESIFAALRGTFNITADAEITMEAAPGQIEDEVLACALSLGVNRVSLGVQSFIDAESRAVGRQHTGAECRAEVNRLHAAGVASVGLDLIAGLPYQTAASWAESLHAVADLGATGALQHVSVYMLEIDEDSRLGQEVLAGGKRFHAHGVPAEELAAELYEAACERLPQAGFAQYEISNFAAPGRQSRHNRKYWQRAPYVGFGLDAHSMLPCPGRPHRAVRFANTDDLNAYTLPGSRGEVTPVDEVAAFEESIFLGLRLNEGLPDSRLLAFAPGLREAFTAGATDLLQEGLLWRRDGLWGLTAQGRLLSNDVFCRVLEAVAA